jgi:alkanesulfonate monooxygenase SsuD/methylene tetrahydromethanopterin reductase-like flavin-dependent oxidoreductase (luciferase family)
MGMYKQQAQDYGYTATARQLGWAVPIYVGETDESAYEEARPHIENFYNKFARMPVEMLLPPGYLSFRSMQALAGKSRASVDNGVRRTIDEMTRQGIFLCGGPETICRLLETYQAQIGFGQIMCLLQFGTLPHDLTRRNLERFATEVIPRLRDLGET